MSAKYRIIHCPEQKTYIYAIEKKLADGTWISMGHRETKKEAEQVVIAVVKIKPVVYFDEAGEMIEEPA